MTGKTDDRPDDDMAATRQISVRVDDALAERFLAARRICEAHGKSLPLAEVVRVGMEAAIREVETTFGEAVAGPAPRPATTRDTPDTR
ncbi:hypothetical protein [Limimaricola sp.]|uniref:hypothetical protein n=1 Tax=Limimaricola sp. TaxID=2211665 RepID=UPI004057D194